MIQRIFQLTFRHDAQLNATQESNHHANILIADILVEHPDFFFVDAMGVQCQHLGKTAECCIRIDGLAIFEQLDDDGHGARVATSHLQDHVHRGVSQFDTCFVHFETPMDYF